MYINLNYYEKAARAAILNRKIVVHYLAVMRKHINYKNIFYRKEILEDLVMQFCFEEFLPHAKHNVVHY